MIISSYRSRLGVAGLPMPGTSYHSNQNLVMFHEGAPSFILTFQLGKNMVDI